MIWLDMDGVLADFDSYYEECFGSKPIREATDWKLVNSVHGFYLKLPAMSDAHELFRYVDEVGEGVGILTGIPSSIDAADNDKRTWAAQNFPDVPVVCCRARDKYQHCTPGDFLIDDYTKYRVDWQRAGGVFIHHVSTAESIRQLKSWGMVSCGEGSSPR
jgi:hypothetical protein